MKPLFICYDRCSTCRRAKKWLDDRQAAYDARPIKEENPTAEELRAWQKMSGKPLKSFFNTSGMKYRELDLKNRLPKMTEEEALALLASDGMLVKRPLLITDSAACPGFQEKAWEEALKG